MKTAGRVLLGPVLGAVTTVVCHVLLFVIMEGVGEMVGMENHNYYVRLYWFLWPAMLGFLIALSVVLFLHLMHADSLLNILLFAGLVVVLAFFLPAAVVIIFPPGEELLFAYLGLLCLSSSLFWWGVLVRPRVGRGVAA